MREKTSETNDELSEAQRSFELAVQLVKSLPQKGEFQPSYSEAGKIYSYFKQSKFGPCTQSKPGFWDVVNRAKWDAWNALGNMSQETAMKNYVEEIKKVYSRIRQIDEFADQEDMFADTLIPFCEVTGIQMSPKLLKIINARIPINKVKINNEIDHNESDQSTNLNEVSLNGTTNGDHLPMNGTMDTNHHGDHINGTKVMILTDNNEHSLLVENSIPASALKKTVSFDDKKENSKEIQSKKNDDPAISEFSSDDENEIYCDSLDPDQVPSFKRRINGVDLDSDFDLTRVSEIDTSLKTTPEKPKQINHHDTSTPCTTKIKSSSSESKSDFELVPRENDRQSVRKRTDKPNNSLQYRNQNTSSDSSTKGFDLLNELQKPYPDRHKCSSDSSKRYGRQVGVRSQKRQGQQHDSQYNEQRSSQSRNPNTLSQGSSQRTSNHPVHHRRRQPSSSNNSGSDDETCSSLDSTSSDNIGLKIVQALERMEDNLHDVLDRLDSIEANMKALTIPPVPWWKQYIPSKRMVVLISWPIIVNLIFWLMWRRMMRRRMRKC